MFVISGCCLSAGVMDDQYIKEEVMNSKLISIKSETMHNASQYQKEYQDDTCQVHMTNEELAQLDDCKSDIKADTIFDQIYLGPPDGANVETDAHVCEQICSTHKHTSAISGDVHKSDELDHNYCTILMSIKKEYSGAVYTDDAKISEASVEQETGNINQPIVSCHNCTLSTFDVKSVISNDNTSIQCRISSANSSPG